MSHTSDQVPEWVREWENRHPEQAQGRGNASQSTEQREERKRPGCLTAYLVLMLASASWSAVQYLLQGSTVRQAYPRAPEWFIPVLTVGAFVQIVFALGIWNWQKWAVYGFIGFALVILVVNLWIGLGVVSFLGLLGLWLLLYPVRPVWHQMD